MFDFEKLDVYGVVKEQNQKVLQFIIQHPEMDEYIASEWKKASMGMMGNLAEGTGKMSDAEKRQYLSDARTCVFRSVAILDTLHGLGIVDDDVYRDLYDGYEKSSKMLLGMYRSYAGGKTGNGIPAASQTPIL
jgi:four helix bundle protein